MARIRINLELLKAAHKHAFLAGEAIEDKDVQTKGKHVGQFQDIIIELNSKFAWSIWDNLLYTSTSANINMRASRMRQCLNTIQELMDEYRKTDKIVSCLNEDTRAGTVVSETIRRRNGEPENMFEASLWLVCLDDKIVFKHATKEEFEAATDKNRKEYDEQCGL